VNLNYLDPKRIYEEMARLTPP